MNAGKIAKLEAEIEDLAHDWATGRIPSDTYYPQALALLSELDKAHAGPMAIASSRGPTVAASGLSWLGRLKLRMRSWFA